MPLPAPPKTGNAVFDNWIEHLWMFLGKRTNTFYPSFDEVDQGVEGQHKSVKSIVDRVGTTKNATIIFRHADTGNTTTYTFSTNETVPSNIKIIVENGAQLSIDTGVTLTINGIFEGSPKCFTGDGSVVINNQPIDVRWYASSGDGSSSSRWANALRNAFAANNDASVYYCPAGQYQDTSTINIDCTGDGGNVVIYGDGRKHTKFYYSQTDDTSLLKLQRDAGAHTLVDVQVRDMGFEGLNTAHGAAIEIGDIRYGAFERLWIQDFDADTTNSKGIWTKGRDNTLFREIRMDDVYKGFHIDINPNHATIDADIFTFDDIIIICSDNNNGYGWYIDADNMYQTVFRQIDVNTCKYGIYWNADGASSNSTTIQIDSFRTEGGDATNKDCWCIYINNADIIEELTLRNVLSNTSHNGLFVDGARQVTLDTCMLNCGSGYTALDADTDVDTLLVLNTDINHTATIAKPSTTLIERIRASRWHELALYSSTSTPGLTLGSLGNLTHAGAGGSISQYMYQASVANLGSFNLPTSTYGWGWVMAGDNEEYAFFVQTSAAVITLISNSANVSQSDSDTNLVLLDMGSYTKIKNRLGTTKNIFVIFFYNT